MRTSGAERESMLREENRRLREQLEAARRDADQLGEQADLQGEECQHLRKRVRDLEEQNESYVRLLEAADAAWKWIGKEYPKVIEEMPPALYRGVREARVPYPAKEHDA